MSWLTQQNTMLAGRHFSAEGRQFFSLKLGLREKQRFLGFCFLT